MRLTEKQVIILEEEDKLAKRFEEENMTLGEYEEELRKIEERFGEQNND